MLNRAFLPLIIRKFPFFVYFSELKSVLTLFGYLFGQGISMMRERKLISFLDEDYWVEKSHTKENL